MKPAPTRATAISRGESSVAVENETSPRETTARKIRPVRLRAIAIPTKAFAGDGTVCENKRVTSKNRTIIATPRERLRMVVNDAELPVMPREG